MKLKKFSLFILLSFVFIVYFDVLIFAGYPDVQENSWYSEAVEKMSEKNYLTGYPDGTFGPQNIITKSEFVNIIVKCKGLADSPTSINHWAGGKLQTALDNNWCDWDEIPPTGDLDEEIPRQLAVKIIMKAFAPQAKGEYNKWSSQIKDFSSLSGRYYDVTFAAYEVGIVKGDSEGCYRGNEGMTRAEACVMIMRALNKYGGETYIEQESVLPIQNKNKDNDTKETSDIKPVEYISGGVSQNGHLQVIGTKLCNEKSEPIILRGMSSHGMQWYGDFVTDGSIKILSDYGSNLFRIAMYTAENGYISNSSFIKQKVIDAVDMVIKNDMYVIIDWHILSDGNPMTYLEQSKAFFKEMAQRYKGNPAVIYEICNEPNGNVSWQNDIKPYAQQVIQEIREIDEKAIILVGSSTWSQDVDIVADNQLEFDNIMYTCHFYSGTHTDWLRQKVDYALSKNAPIFVTEWGTSDASGNGGVYKEETQKWLDFMKERNISWANWSLCDKSETSAALVNGASKNGDWTKKDLSESGKIVFKAFKE